MEKKDSIMKRQKVVCVVSDFRNFVPAPAKILFRFMLANPGEGDSHALSNVPASCNILRDKASR
jgi:hypothetical protein